MKKVLVISPYFPPVNAADMHRVRMSVPYFKNFDWNAELVIVDDKYVDIAKDELLLQSVPNNIVMHKVKAFSKKWTSKIGLGSIGLRSLFFYLFKVNSLLKKNNYDLIYFSTTQFPVCILGAFWKRRFKIPYIIDMQDPWFSNYYQDKPKAQRPKKYWFSYHLNKFLEPIAIKNCDGLISVSENYILDLKARYPSIKNIPAETITFGAYKPDFDIANRNRDLFKQLFTTDFINVVYIGRGGSDMHKAISPVFEALGKGLRENPDLFGKLRFYFIGTSYASSGSGTETIMPLAKRFNVENSVIEITNRISYYQSLNLLNNADALFIPGSDDPKYTASKIYPYLLTLKPLLAIFNQNSNIVNTLKACTVNSNILTFNETELPNQQVIFDLLINWASANFVHLKLNENFEQFLSENLTGRQTNFFSEAIEFYKQNHITK